MNNDNGREKLNRLGEKWYNMPEHGNEAIRLSLCEEIFGLAYKLFPKQNDAMGLFFEKDWDKFDPDKGDLYGFMSFRLKRRMTDLGRQDTGGDESLDESLDGESDVVRGDTFVGDTDVDDSDLMIDETVLNLMTLMLDLKGRLGGRAGNPEKINYYRLFFTDGVVDAIHCYGVKIFARRERDLLRAIKETFLNFFMSSPCGSVEDILRTAMKPYGQMVEGRPMEPPKQPLPNDVYTTYLEQVENSHIGASTVSQQRTAYRKFMKAQLQC